MQVVVLHPSCGLRTKPEWVLFNEFVLTTGPYIRTVSEVRPEWHALAALRGAFVTNIFSRLIESAGNYFDISTFPKGEMKRALQRVINKRAGKSSARVDSGKGDRKAKKEKNRALDSGKGNRQLTKKEKHKARKLARSALKVSNKTKV